MRSSPIPPKSSLKLWFWIPLSIVSVLLILWMTYTPEEIIERHKCRDELGCVVIGPEEPVVIGIIQDLSGGAAEFGKVQLNAFQLALEQRGGTLSDHKTELRIEDEMCSEAGGKNAALKIVSDPQTVAVFGTTCSLAAVPASRIISDAGMVLISGLNSAPSLTSFGEVPGIHHQRGYFRTSTNEALRAHAAAHFAWSGLGLKRAAVIDDGDTYTRGSTDIFFKEFLSLGGEVVFRGTVDKGDVNMKPLLTAVIQYEPDLIYFPLFAAEALHLVQQHEEFSQLKEVQLISGSVLLTDESLASLGDSAARLYFSDAPEPRNAKALEFIASFGERFGEHSENEGCTSAYDAANILFDSIEQVSFHESDGTLHIGREALREALYSVENYRGTTGLLTADEWGDLGIDQARIVIVEKDSKGQIHRKEVFLYERP